MHFVTEVQRLGWRARAERGEREVVATELSSRFKWLAGTLHLVVRRIYEEEDGRERIEGFVEEYLSELNGLTNRFEVLIQAWKALEERVSGETWLGKKLRALGVEEIFQDGGLESFKELSQDYSRVICEHIEEQVREQMLAAKDLKELRTLLLEEIERHYNRICEEAAGVVHRQSKPPLQ